MLKLTWLLATFFYFLVSSPLLLLLLFRLFFVSSLPSLRLGTQRSEVFLELSHRAVEAVHDDPHQGLDARVVVRGGKHY